MDGENYSTPSYAEVAAICEKCIEHCLSAGAWTTHIVRGWIQGGVRERRPKPLLYPISKCRAAAMDDGILGRTGLIDRFVQNTGKAVDIEVKVHLAFHQLAAITAQTDCVLRLRQQPLYL